LKSNEKPGRVKTARRENPRHPPVSSTNSCPIEKAVPVRGLNTMPARPGLVFEESFFLGWGRSISGWGGPCQPLRIALPINTVAIADAI
jgi:hypothetical protein